MTKIEIQVEPSNSEKPFGHLLPIVDALIDSGNSPTESTKFYLTQDGWHCTLSKPIDFELVTNRFRIPESIVINKEADQIWCQNTWVIVHGGDSVERALQRYEDTTLKSPDRKY